MKLYDNNYSMCSLIALNLNIRKTVCINSLLLPSAFRNVFDQVLYLTTTLLDKKDSGRFCCKCTKKLLYI